MTDVVNKLWGFCHTLRHDGVDYGDYIEQLTYLLFLKMADERDIDLTKIAWTDEKGNTPPTAAGQHSAANREPHLRTTTLKCCASSADSRGC